MVRKIGLAFFIILMGFPVLWIGLEIYGAWQRSNTPRLERAMYEPIHLVIFIPFTFYLIPFIFGSFLLWLRQRQVHPARAFFEIFFLLILAVLPTVYFYFLMFNM